MRAMMAWGAALLAAAFVVSCATSKPATAPGSGIADTVAAADSTGQTAEGLFVEKHASLLAALSSREASAPADLGLIEARSLVSAAEETYLRGSTLLALDILDRAEEILRRSK